MAFWHHLGIAVGITALVGCGNSKPDGPVSSPTSGSADAIVSPPPVGVGPWANDPRREGSASTTLFGTSNRDTAKSGAPVTNNPRAAQPAPDVRVQTAASPRDTPPPDEQITADQAQREARQLWFVEMRENPDVTVRLQALELWAEQPSDGIDPLTFALVDEDEQVRARAQELWAQQLTQEVEATVP